MMRKIQLTLLVSMITGMSFGQKYISKNAQINFFSKTPLENISASNYTGTVILSVAEKKVASVIVMRNFKFKKPLMEEHFNENYLETTKYPKSTFSGTYENEVDFEKDGKYTTEISGFLTLHGITKQIKFPAIFQVNNGKITAEAKVQIALADYKISVPKIVFYKIAENIEVTLHIDFNKSK